MNLTSGGARGNHTVPDLLGHVRGIVAAMVGIWHVLTGIAAIAEDDQTEELAEVLDGIDITAWGWFWIVVGALQIVTAWLIFARSPLGQIAGVIWPLLTYTEEFGSA